MADKQRINGDEYEQPAGGGSKSGPGHEGWRMLGPVAWLMSQSSQHRNLFIGDFAWLVIPALSLKQCRLYMHKGMPIAYTSWARVNDEVHERLRNGQPRLAPGEWRSGGRVWLMDVVAPFGGGKQVVEDVRARELAGEDVNVMAPGSGGSGVTHQTLRAADSEGSAERGSAADAPAQPEQK